MWYEHQATAREGNNGTTFNTIFVGNGFKWKGEKEGEEDAFVNKVAKKAGKHFQTLFG